MERKIKLWSGTPERNSVCRLSKEESTQLAVALVANKFSKKYAHKIVNYALAEDKLECVRADAQAFAAFAGITFQDLGVLLRYQEALLYSCERWKQ
jgi:hypothetical protein